MLAVWKKIPIKCEIEGRSCTRSVVYDEKILFFGGLSGNKFFNKLMSFDYKTYEINQIIPDNNFNEKELEDPEKYPPGRSGHNMVIYKDTLIIIGGIAHGTMKDSYCFDLKTHGCIKVKKINLDIYFHSLIQHEDCLFIFGGDSQKRHHNNKFRVFSMEKMKFIRYRTKGKRPCARSRHSAFVWNNKMFIFGGTGSLESSKINELDDLHCLDFKTKRWELIETYGTKPEKRRSFTCNLYKDKMYIFGGVNSVGKHFNDFFQFDLIRNTWTKVAAIGDIPSPRAAPIGEIINSNMYLTFGSFQENMVWTQKNDFHQCSILNELEVHFWEVFKNQELMDLEFPGTKAHLLLMEKKIGALSTKIFISKVKNNNDFFTKEEIRDFVKWIYTGILSPNVYYVAKIARFDISKCPDLSQILTNMEKEEKEKDFKIIYKKHVIKVHKLILQARSNLFRGMFLSLSHNENSVKNFCKVHIETLKIFIRFLYTCEIIIHPDFDKEFICKELEDCAEFYQLPINSKLYNLIDNILQKEK
ncbi:hypothetical protein M0813_19144 [Anaeramoeba flamelloides]|uniref:BTB domain-containing protein n=1 Tax=Anaeramoeba flamelloides TaxID=1746091 RepID=A0AAV7ZVA7_9EUKA|nr:hypothetical protein M0812_11731 [Anaeramoeba flamelloides]KAJ6246477.1 hypothetical protein M0813_19144 [Anaeramoeba flamelloides]